jgi:hypothetical protein
MEKRDDHDDPKGKKLLTYYSVQERNVKLPVSPFIVTLGDIVELPSIVVVIQPTFSFDSAQQFDDGLPSANDAYHVQPEHDMICHAIDGQQQEENPTKRQYDVIVILPDSSLTNLQMYGNEPSPMNPQELATPYLKVAASVT